MNSATGGLSKRPPSSSKATSRSTGVPAKEARGLARATFSTPAGSAAEASAAPAARRRALPAESRALAVGLRHAADLPRTTAGAVKVEGEGEVEEEEEEEEEGAAPAAAAAARRSPATRASAEAERGFQPFPFSPLSFPSPPSPLPAPPLGLIILYAALAASSLSEPGARTALQSRLAAEPF